MVEVTMFAPLLTIKKTLAQLLRNSLADCLNSLRLPVGLKVVSTTILLSALMRNKTDGRGHYVFYKITHLETSFTTVNIQFG
jgi:hypothetical protein